MNPDLGISKKSIRKKNRDAGGQSKKRDEKRKMQKKDTKFARRFEQFAQQLHSLMDRRFPPSWAAAPSVQDIESAFRAEFGKPISPHEFGFSSNSSLILAVQRAGGAGQPAPKKKRKKSQQAREEGSPHDSHFPATSPPANVATRSSHEDSTEKRLLHQLNWSCSFSSSSGVSLLHEQIGAVAALATPDAHELSRRQAAAMRVARLVYARCPRGELQVFGSCVTMLSLPGSDLDCEVVVDDSVQPLYLLESLATGLRCEGVARPGTMKVIGNASVPIARYVDAASGIHIDVSVNNGGHTGSERVRQELAIRPALRPVLLVLKIFLRQACLHETYTGGIGSHLLFAMALRALARKLPPNESAAAREVDLGDLLCTFLRTYASGSASLSLLDPLAGYPVDIGSKAFKFAEVRKRFRNVLQQLEAPGSRPCLSMVLKGWPAGKVDRTYDLKALLRKRPRSHPRQHGKRQNQRQPAFFSRLIDKLAMKDVYFRALEL
uniref:HTH OST-type domain-containing protein n=1 Tax=Chrysotila carterae TaxID=13221 RepID=A0A7S4EU00_CHRCT